jgi:hypothetical protein
VTLALFIVVPTSFLAGGTPQKGGAAPAPPQKGGGGAGQQGVKGKDDKIGELYASRAVGFAKTPALRDITPSVLTPEQEAKFKARRENQEKNAANRKIIKPIVGTKGGTNAGINNTKNGPSSIKAVTNPIQNFDGPDADTGAPLFGTRFAPPDTNGAVGPNHVVITTNMGMRVYDKSGNPLTAQVRLSTIMAGIANAGDDDGDPIVLYDSLADRWLISQFNLRFTGNQMHQHFAISETGDPTGAYFAYDFLLAPGRFVDYPHFGVWGDGYYMSSNDFTPPGVAPFLGAGLYSFEREKMLAGDPTASVIAFTTGNTHGGMLPTNLQGFAVPPAGTPNLFIEFDADEFGAATDLIRPFEFRPDYVVPGNSTLIQLADIPVVAFDARQPASRSVIAQPAPGEGLDSIADRLMHAMNFRVLAGGVQSYVLNWTVNVSGVNPTNSATYQGGVRWMELRRNSGTGVVTINQQATYAPGSGDPTGRDLWMSSIAQDGEGNIGLASNAANSTATPALLNPTAVYTGRLAADPVNTLPQGEVDAFSAVTKGVQTATANRWGDYSSLFVDPADECTFWAFFEYVDSPTATFDWNTRAFSFMVNPTCVTAPKGQFSGTITNCVTGLPIEDAIVETTDGFIRITPVNGTYSITAAPGTYTVQVSKPGAGFNTATGMVTVTNGGNATFNACLAPSAIIASAGATIVTEGCSPANGAVDPGETVTVSLCVQNTGGLDTTSLVGTLQATGGVTGPSGPQNYGVVVAGGPPVCRNFTFTAAGSCGGTVTATLDLQDGASSLGSVTYTFTLGTQAVALTENFDGVVVPALPAGWTATVVTGPPGTINWTSSNAGTPAPPADTAPNAAFIIDPNVITDVVLDTPAIAITTASAVLTFRNNFNLEDGFDGGVVEISIGAGAFTDIITAGGSFVAGTQSYTDTISVNFMSPIAGRMAFSGSSGGFVTTSINLPAAAAGQSVRIRFRRASDSSVAGVGWRVDTINITDGFECCAGGGVVPCAENFDMVTAPALPTGWTATTAIDCVGAFASDPWATSTTTPDTAPNAAFVNEPNCISDERLDSRMFPITSATAVLTFRNSFNMENGFDGGVLEISIGGGAFQDIIAAGGSFATGGYNGVISVNFGSPIAGRNAWTGNSAGYITTTVNLPASANGQSIVLRWRRGSDSSVSGQGWRIDTIDITGSNCGANPCVLTCPANITQSNDPNQCGAVVNYPAPTTTGDCGTVTCSPANGSFFPVGTTTVTCTPTTGPACSFTVTVVDTQPPTITCPTNVIAVTAAACPAPTSTVVTFPPPTASDNCPGVTVVCVPPSGSPFPVGTTTVTCTATDASGNTATCSFTIKIFNAIVQDRTNPAAVLAWNTTTGEYIFCCNGSTFSGVGKVSVRGCTYTIDHNPPDKRVHGQVDFTTFRGEGSLQSPAGTIRCTISDDDVRNNSSSCFNGGGGGPVGPTK